LKIKNHSLKQDNRRSSLLFVILIGIASLFADMTYEGARSITGPFLSVLGASGAAVGFVAGLGELVGYAFRLASGYISDRTGKYWTITLIGYFINMLAVPTLALAGRWETAAALIIAERLGKAIRNPARDAMLSHATANIGQGWGFGLHEALDQIGAISGPLIIAIILYFKGTYQRGFAVLLIPALLTLSIILLARYLFPQPKNLETITPSLETKGLSRTYFLYLFAIAFNAAGYADFPLIAYHFQKIAIVPPSEIPLFYAVAMGVDAIAALVFGRLFDRYGLSILIISVAFSSLFPPLVFFGNFSIGLAGMVLWGVGMGAQESIMRAFVALTVPPEKRGTAYGLFNTGYGIFWFLGSAVMGLLYDHSLTALVAFSMMAQLASIPLLFSLKSKRKG